MKGTSEAPLAEVGVDPFASFELMFDIVGSSDTDAEALTNLLYEYARSALAVGLSEYEKTGDNPFKFGMIGSTDTHTALSSADESCYYGKSPAMRPRADRTFGAALFDDVPEQFKAMLAQSMAWKLSASGYAAIWAEENTRESLFAAMKRREVYASTGPRIELRFFGGWEYGADAAYRPNLARIGYEGGVPMGGDLSSAPDGKAPRFLIRAVKDPLGANLDRVQVIKGWLDEDGETHERVYDVALSDGRCACAGSKALPVGSTVDIADASYTNTIGDPELAVVWEDPDFDASEPAFYYVRVLEIPTPRWTAYDAKAFDIPLEDIPADVPMTLQERAYSSPIWYSL